MRRSSSSSKKAWSRQLGAIDGKRGLAETASRVIRSGESDCGDNYVAHLCNITELEQMECEEQLPCGSLPSFSIKYRTILSNSFVNGTVRSRIEMHLEILVYVRKSSSPSLSE